MKRLIILVLAITGFVVPLGNVASAATPHSAAPAVSAQPINARAACGISGVSGLTAWTPIVQDLRGPQERAYGQVRQRNRNANGCGLRVCVQQRNGGSWYNATACQTHYASWPHNYLLESLPLYFDCEGIPDYRDDVRSYYRRLDEAVGAGRVSAAVRDVCPGNGTSRG